MSLVPYVQDPDLKIYQGDALSILRQLPDESVHMCVTSPAYWGLRDYGVEGQLGLEPTPDEYVAKMVEVFREVRRVLRSDGTCWLNIGDSYATAPGKGDNVPQTKWPTNSYPEGAPHRSKRIPRGEGRWGGGNNNAPGLKPKDLCMIPARLALALQADGWWLRSQIVWAKPNPMPESVTDRPTQATEMVYLLAKSPRYYYDAEAVREKADWERWGAQTPRKTSDKDARGAAFVKSRSRQELLEMAGQRNLRNWWPIATEPYPEAHFATYPTELVRRCILAGTSERGCCPECGAPWVRETETERGFTDGKCNGCGRPRAQHVVSAKSIMSGSGGSRAVLPSGSKQEGSATRLDDGAVPCAANTTTGWHPSCSCNAGEPVPCTVADVFLGSGTTALVARKLNRRCIGIELSSDYCALAARRTQQLSLEAEVA